MICRKCRSATVIKGDRLSDEIIYCTEWGDRKEVTFNVVKCNQFSNVLDKDKYELEKIAWILEVRKGRPIGFVSPVERFKRNQEVDDI